jgi:alpha-L-fucosidase 2
MNKPTTLGLAAMNLSSIALPHALAQEQPIQPPVRGAASAQPTRYWEHAFVSGNGHMSAMVFGNPDDETVLGNHCKLFLPLGSKVVVPDIGQHLPELRKVIRERGYGRGMGFMMEKAKEQGWVGFLNTDPFHPGFELKMRVAVTGTARDYLRTENFQTGEVGVRWRDDRGLFQRKLFVSRPDNVIPMKMSRLPSASGEAVPPLTVDLWVSPIPDLKVRAYTLNHQLPPEAPEAAANVLIQSQNVTGKDWITLHNVYKFGEASGYDSAIRVVTRGGSVTSDGQKVSIKNAAEVLVLMRIEPFAKAEQSSMEQLKTALSKLPASYEALLTPHAKAHGDIFNRVTLDLGGGSDRNLTTDELMDRAIKENTIPPALMEKIYDAGRYVFISSSGERSPNLQGIWTGTWQPAWSGDYTTNTNLQLAVASAQSGNMLEPMESYYRLIEEYLPDWRLNAKGFYGARGVLAPSRESNHGKLIHWSDRFYGSFWTCGAGWLAHWFYDHYLYTGDREFLAKRAVPLLKEVALFYEDFLFIDESGKYRFSPSESAEQKNTVDNSTQDIAVAREVLTNLIAACTELGIERENIPKWKAMLDKMPPYLVDAEGALQEWAVPGVPNKDNHRHMSHLYPVFQSYEFSPEATPEMWKASEIAFENRLNKWFRASNAKGNNSQASHGRMHMGLIAARLGKGDIVWEILTKMVTSRAMYASLVTAHYENGKTFNVDANGGIPEVINNSLLFALPGQLDLLPALPTGMPRGEIRGLLARGQLQINRLRWEPGVVEVELVSGKPQTLRVRVPKAMAVETFEASGGNVKINPAAANARTVTLPANVPVKLRITTR